MRLAEKVFETKDCSKQSKYGLCKFSETCWLYTPGDYHCNQVRAFNINPNNPECYKPLKEKVNMAVRKF